MKEKLTIEEKLQQQNYKQPSNVLWWVLNKLVVKSLLEKKFHPTYNIIDDINKEEGPCFLIYNHSSRSDYIWLTQACYPRKMNFVTGYNEFYRSKFSSVFKLLGQIPKKNYTSDMLCMKGMRQIIKDNGVVCFAPEGMSSIVGHNQPVIAGTGKLFKHYNIPVYCLTIHGGYLTNHKVDLSDRFGRVEVELKRLFTKEDIASLTNEELENKTNEALWNDDYEWGQKNHVKFDAKGNIASHLHDICYKCPKCNTEFEMIGEKNYLKCNHCGNGTYINDYYEFEPFENSYIPYSSPSKWTDEERKLVYKEIQNDNFYIEEKVTLGELPKYKLLKDPDTSVKCGEGIVRIDHTGLTFTGTKNEENFTFHLDYNTLFSLVIVTDCTFFSLYVNGKYYEFHPEKPVVGKMLLVTEEMHRLHVNKWKNLPWLSDFYN